MAKKKLHAPGHKASGSASGSVKNTKNRKNTKKTSREIVNEPPLVSEESKISSASQPLKVNRNFSFKKKKVERIRTSNETRLRKIEDEEWKRIDFVKHKYTISNYGRLKSYYFDPEGKLLKLRVMNGFYYTDFAIDGKRKKFLIHKLVAMFFVPKEKGDETVVTHLDWNLKNNYYKNLKWLTKEEANKRVLKYLSSKSTKRTKKEMIVNAKLDDDSVRKLKEMLKGGVRQNIIAKFFNLSEMQITRIKRGENWGHVKIEED